MALSLALMCAGPGTASAASPGSTDELRLSTTQPGASTGIFATEIFNARYPNGQLKPLRHSLVAFPKGTRFDAMASDTCAATDSDFKSKGMSACPPSTQTGSGQAETVTSGTPTEAGPIPLDVTVFGRTDGSLIVFSRNGAYLSSARVRADGRFQNTEPPVNCAVVTEQPPCQHGEFVPRSLTVDIPARSRIVGGRVHNLITTPQRCPKSGHWIMFDKHTFADGSFDLFVNPQRCVRKRSRRARSGRPADPGYYRSPSR